jgi:hypothetical protein
MPSGMNVGDVFMAMLLDSSDFQASAQKEGQKAGETAGAAMSTGIKGRLSDLFKGSLMVGVGIELGRQLVQGLESAVKDVIDVIPNMVSQGQTFVSTVHEMMLATDASAEEASTFTGILMYLGHASGLSSVAIRTLSNELVTNKDLFAQWGIAITNAAGQPLNTLEILDNVRHRLADDTTLTAAEKDSVAVKLLGRNALDMLDYLHLSDAAVLVLKQDMAAFGVVLTSQDVQSVMALTREQQLWNVAMQGLANTVTVTLAPVITQFFAQLTNFVATNGPQIQAFFINLGNTIDGVLSGLLGGNLLQPLQIQLDSLNNTGVKTADTFKQWMSTQGADLGALTKTTSGTKDATAAIDAQTAAIKSRDTADENAFQGQMTRLGLIYQKQLDALGLEEQQEALDEQRRSLNEQLNQAQIDLAAAQAGKDGKVDAQAVSDAMAKIADIEHQQAQAQLQADRDAQKARLQGVKDFIDAQAKLESSTTVTQTTKIKTFTSRETSLSTALDVAKAKGDAQAITDIEAELAAVRAARARTERATKNADQQSDLDKEKASLAAAGAAATTSNGLTLAQWQAQYKTYTAEIATENKNMTEHAQQIIGGDPAKGTGLGGSIIKAFTDGQAAGEAFRKFLAVDLVGAIHSVIDALSGIKVDAGIQTTVGLGLVAAGTATLNPVWITAGLALVAAAGPPGTTADPFGNAGPGKGSRVPSSAPVGSAGGGTWTDLTSTPKAAGGPVQAHVPYIVGERRPELFVPGENGRIIPSLGGLGGMAGSDTVLHTHIDLDGREVADVVSRYQADDYRR